MDEFVRILVDKWKNMIESIHIGDYTKKINSVDIINMHTSFTSAHNTDIEYCYKVSFNFDGGMCDDISENSTDFNIAKSWSDELENKFIEILDENGYELSTFKDFNFINNSKADYMTNQGYRFIVQFYPGGFIKELRNDRLEELGI